MIQTDYDRQRFIAYQYQGKTKKLYGGSFFLAPHDGSLLEIDLMAEMHLPCDWWLPILDHQCPRPEQIPAMEQIFAAIKKDPRDSYVGCFGGIGRTGLFLACFLKSMGEEAPIIRVRSQYDRRAMETSEQVQFVLQFPAGQVMASPMMEADGRGGVPGDGEEGAGIAGMRKDNQRTGPV